MAKLYGAAVTVKGAGRTDAGVHATGQVIAFAADDRIPVPRIARALNGQLPQDVSVRAAAVAEPGFDPRRQATARVYRYTLALDCRRQPLRDRYATRIEPGLDLERMEQAAAGLVGTHDFQSLCCNQGQQGSTRRELRTLSWDRRGELVSLVLEGSSFLYRQVRCIVGVLVAIGRGKFGVELVEALLAGRERPPQIAVAPPTGLVLEQVRYNGLEWDSQG